MKEDSDCDKSGGSKLKDKIEISKAGQKKKSYVLDLRIHSPASLGYLGIEGIDTAPAMVRLAKVKGLDVIAITDFYSADFTNRVSAAADGSKVTVLPGTSIRCKLGSCQELVIVCLFPEAHRKNEIENFLVDLKVPKEQFGNEKYVVNLSFADVVKTIDKHGAIAIPSRIDKTPHTLLTLPALIEDYGFRTFDLAYADTKQFFKEKWPKINFNLYSFSSASALAQVGSRSAKVKLPAPSFAAIMEVAKRADF